MLNKIIIIIINNKINNNENAHPPKKTLQTLKNTKKKFQKAFSIVVSLTKEKGKTELEIYDITHFIYYSHMNEWMTISIMQNS